MINLLGYMSLIAIPIMMSIILLHGLIKKVNMYDAFVEGAKDGFKTAISIIPYLVAIYIAIGFMRKSGVIDYLISAVKPVTTFIGIPAEVLPLAIMRPVSGSGALAVLSDVLHTYGPDSFIGRLASTMMGSAETIFYTMAIYFGAVGIKKSRHTVGAALISHLASVVAAVIICTYFFKI